MHVLDFVIPLTFIRSALVTLYADPLPHFIYKRPPYSTLYLAKSAPYTTFLT